MRKKIFQQYDIPTSVVNIVIALCGDYPRRKKSLQSNAAPVDILESYKNLNVAIDKALEDIEVGLRGIIISDITEYRGYNKSGAQVVISKNAYYRRRRKLIHDIAVGMRLI
jgi:hypothetical protein